MIQIDDLIGIPYKPHGRDRRGLDCYGLIMLIAERRGTPLADVWYERNTLDLMDFARDMGVHKMEKCEPGCIIEMDCRGRLHLGYAIGKDRMIHAPYDGVCIDQIGDSGKIRGYYGFD